MKTWGIKNQVLLLALFPTIAISFLLGIYFTSVRVQDLEYCLKNLGKTLTLRLTFSAENALFTKNLSELHNLASRTMMESDVHSVVFFDTHGNKIIKMGLSNNSMPSAFDFRTVTPQKKLMIHETPETLTFIAPIFLRTTHPNYHKQHTGWLMLELNRYDTHLREYEIILSNAIIVLLGLTISGILALKLGHDVTLPIMRLTEKVEEITRGNFKISLPHEQPLYREFQILESGIHTMATELQNAHGELQNKVSKATADLRRSLEMIEVQNIELELARKHAENLNEMKSQFLANMSHEIRTPLNGLIGFIHLIKKSPLDTRQAEYILIVEKSSNYLLAIINDILDFSKIEANKLQLEFMPIDLYECVEDVLTLFAPNAQEKHIELVPIIYSDVPHCVMCDPMRIKQILSNLVSNAIKFTAEGGIIVRVMLEQELATQYRISISVTDTGIGLSLDEQKALFQAFNQPMGTSRKYGGTGLGLSISKKLVEQMGGAIGLESETGKGATFWFTFVADKPEESLQSTEEPSQLQGIRLLLCERNPMTRLALSHLLICWGIRVQEIDQFDHITPTLEKAIADNDPFWIVLFGVNQLGNLNYAYRSYPCPTAILGNTSDREQYQSLLDQGVALYLSKPITRKKLFDALCQLLSMTNSPYDAPLIGLPPEIDPLPAPPISTQIQVLTVDDHPDNLKLIQALVHELGVEADTALSGPIALVRVKEQRYDLIFMDIQMPEMDGIETTEAIRAWESQEDLDPTPIVALTAHAMVNEREALMQAGFNDYLIKPVIEQTLRMIISKWTQRGITFNRAVSPAVQIGNSKVEAIQKDILSQLIETLPEEQLAITQAFEDRDLALMRDRVHRLHGAVCYCGVPAFRACIQALESAIVIENHNAIADCFHAFINECNQLCNTHSIALL
jgi:two-component system sensor histidine kinase BarA